MSARQTRPLFSFLVGSLRALWTSQPAERTPSIAIEVVSRSGSRAKIGIPLHSRLPLQSVIKLSQSSSEFSQGIRDYQRQDGRRLRVERCGLGTLLHLSPRDGFSNLRTAQRAVVFSRGRDVARIVEPPLEEVPPQDVVLAYAAADDHRAGALGPVDEVREVVLVLDDIYPEVPVLLCEEPELAPHRAVHDSRHKDWNVLSARSAQKRVVRIEDLSQLSTEFTAAEAPSSSGIQAGEGRLDLSFYQGAVVVEPEEEVTQPVIPLPVQLPVVHLEVSVIVGSIRPGDIVVERSAGGHYDIDESLIHHLHEDSAKTRRNGCGGGGEEHRAPRVAPHPDNH